MGWAVFRVVRVPWPNTRSTRNNFGYRGLEPKIGFGFFGFGFFGFGLGFFGLGFRVSGILPTYTGYSVRSEFDMARPDLGSARTQGGVVSVAGRQVPRRPLSLRRGNSVCVQETRNPLFSVPPVVEHASHTPVEVTVKQASSVVTVLRVTAAYEHRSAATVQPSLISVGTQSFT